MTPAQLAATLTHETPEGAIWVARTGADFIRHSIELREAEIEKLKTEIERLRAIGRELQ